VKAERKKGH